MTYAYKELEIVLKNEEVYWLWDLIAFAIDYDVEHDQRKLTDEKRNFARKLLDITNETR